jgi:hypothetical protein
MKVHLFRSVSSCVARAILSLCSSPQLPPDGSACNLLEQFVNTNHAKKADAIAQSLRDPLPCAILVRVSREDHVGMVLA